MQRLRISPQSRRGTKISEGFQYNNDNQKCCKCALWKKQVKGHCNVQHAVDQTGDNVSGSSAEMLHTTTLDQRCSHPCTPKKTAIIIYTLGFGHKQSWQPVNFNTQKETVCSQKRKKNRQPSRQTIQKLKSLHTKSTDHFSTNNSIKPLLSSCSINLGLYFIQLCPCLTAFFLL